LDLVFVDNAGWAINKVTIMPTLLALFADKYENRCAFLSAFSNITRLVFRTGRQEVRHEERKTMLIL
jgi:hypothetical protein